MRQAITAIIFAVALVACNTSDHSEAVNAARSFSKNISDATGVDCAERDTDHDGYCTCTVFRREHDPLRIDCGCERYCFNCVRGCKLVVGYKGNGNGR